MDDALGRSGDEGALRDAILRGEDAAWELLHARTFPAHALWTRRRCAGDDDLADELIQETWMIAVRRIRRFDPGRGTFQSWLRGITANVLRDRLRRMEGRTPAALEEVAVTAEPDATERVELALVQLLPEHRDLLRAKYVERLTTAEIAGRLHRTEKSVESLLTRARAAFRVAWART